MNPSPDAFCATEEWKRIKAQLQARQETQSSFHRLLDPQGLHHNGWAELKEALEKFPALDTDGGRRAAHAQRYTNEEAKKLFEHFKSGDSEDCLDLQEFYQFLFRGRRRTKASILQLPLQHKPASPEKGSREKSPRPSVCSVTPRKQASRLASAMLQPLVGMGEVKQQVERFEKSLRLDQKRQELKQVFFCSKRPHMAFYGNPGTGKTCIAKIMGRVLNSLGYLTKGHLVEVQRSHLVADKIGATALKTREVIESARGGVLFIDEAYRLVSSGSEKDFGREALDELMEGMNVGDPVMIFAGYRREMDHFLNSNPGLFRRISKHFFFEDYTPQELARIFFATSEKQGFKCGAGLDEPWLEALLQGQTSPAQRSRTNGGLVELLIQAAKEELDSRLDEDMDETRLADVICTLEQADVTKAMDALEQNWQKVIEMRGSGTTATADIALTHSIASVLSAFAGSCRLHILGAVLALALAISCMLFRAWR